MTVRARIAENDLAHLADQVGVQQRHDGETLDAFIARLRAGLLQFSPSLRRKLETHIADRVWEIEQPIA